MKSRVVAVLLFGSVAVCEGSGRWYVEAGPWHRLGMEMNIEGNSIEASREIGVSDGGSMVTPPDGILLNDDGSEALYRVFDNGFVGPSGWGWAQAIGETQYWGYDTAGQYDAGANTLQFQLTLHDAGSAERDVSRVVEGDVAINEQITSDHTGAQITAGYVLSNKKSFIWSLQTQVAWLPGARFTGARSLKDRLMIETTTYRSSYDIQEQWLYTYDTFGNPAFPSAPYYMENASGAGPVISDRPISIQSAGERQVTFSDGIARVSRVMVSADTVVDANADSLILNLGPRLSWRMTPRIGVLLQAGITLNMLDADVTRTETFYMPDGLVVQSEMHQVNEQAWLAGASVACGLEMNLSERIYAVVNGGYDFVEPHSFPIGPDRVTLDLSGYRMEASIGFRFGR